MLELLEELEDDEALDDESDDVLDEELSELLAGEPLDELLPDSRLSVR